MRLYFENPVGRVMEHPDGYALVQYHPGARQLEYLQAFLRHTGQLLQARGWSRMLSDQRQLEPFTPAESAWIVEYWLSEENQGQPVRAAILVNEAAWAVLPPEATTIDNQAAALTYHLFVDEAAAAAWLAQAR